MVIDETSDLTAARRELEVLRAQAVALEKDIIREERRRGGGQLPPTLPPRNEPAALWGNVGDTKG
jgi:hypothetical protein